MEKKPKTPAAAGPGLWKKIHSVQTKAGYVQKDTVAKMGSSDKKVASIEAVLDIYLPLCGEHGLTVVPVDIEIVSREYKQGKYNVDFHILCMLKYRVVDVETGEFHEFKILSYGLDSQDKATGKMLTYGLKYAYAQLFSSRKGDDPDVNLPDDKPKNQEKPKQEEKKQDASSDEDVGAREAFQNLVMEIKEAFPIDPESKNVPKWTADYKPATDDIAAKGLDQEMKQALQDFAFFHWNCINVICNPKIDAAAATFEKGKSKLAPNNIKYLESMIAKRRSAK